MMFNATLAESFPHTQSAVLSTLLHPWRDLFCQQGLPMVGKSPVSLQHHYSSLCLLPPQLAPHLPKLHQPLAVHCPQGFPMVGKSPVSLQHQLLIPVSSPATASSAFSQATSAASSAVSALTSKAEGVFQTVTCEYPYSFLSLFP